MTKDQERKQLEKIAALIQEAGDDSYIGMAFCGCVKWAAQNINDDWGNNPQEMIATRDRQIEQAKKDRTEAIRGYEKIAAELKSEQAAANNLRGALNSAEECIRDQAAKVGEQAAELERLRAEVIKLKAKLYDLICTD